MFCCFAKKSGKRPTSIIEEKKSKVTSDTLYQTYQNMLYEKEKLKNLLFVLQLIKTLDTQRLPTSIERDNQPSEEAIKAAFKLFFIMDRLAADLRLRMKDEERQEMQGFERNFKLMPTKI